MKNKKTVIRIIRIIFYALAVLYLLISQVKSEYSFIICPTKRLFNVDCYLCGMTRAFISMFHLNFKQAIEFNPLVVVFYPLFVLIAIQDAFISVKDIIFKKDSKSFLEFIGERFC